MVPMMPTNPAEFWTMVTGVATLLLVGVAALGLNSLALVKRDMWNRTTREAVQSAIDRCDEMARELVPLYQEVVNALHT
jgi:hypothetical protein